VLFTLCVAKSPGACLPLPTSELRTLEQQTTRDPQGAIAEARRRLDAAATGRDPLMAGELNAIIADALSLQGRADEAHAAVASARNALGALPASDGKQRVLDQLVLTYVQNAESRADLTAGVQSINEVLARAAPGSNERACALAARGDLRGELLELDDGAADGIAAYTAAEHGNFAEARIQSAFSLAVIYRRSGMLDDALRMIDEVIRFATANGSQSQLATALYSRGQIEFAGGHFNVARDTLETSRKIAAAAGDAFGAAFTDVALCPALISSGDLDAAERVCSGNVDVFSAAKRDDLVTLLLGYRARLDLQRGRPGAALAKLDEVLGPRSADVLPNIEPQFYLDRSRAQRAMGNFSDAYADLSHSLDLQRVLDVEQRARAAAVLVAAREAEKSLEDRQALARRVWVVAGVAATLIVSLLCYLLWMRNRHERTLERAQKALRTASNSTPDTLMLLDAQRAVRFANRALFGMGPAPAPGASLEETVDGNVWSSLQTGLTEVYEHRRPGTLSISVADERGSVRQFEVRVAPVIEGGELVGATVRCTDVTEVRSLEREVLDISTRERQRLSSELHDGLGQELTGISLLLRNLDIAIERGKPGIRGLLDEIVQYTRRAIITTRDIARGLSPMQVERGSLSGAIMRLAAEAGDRLHLEITASSTPQDIVLPEEAADHLYRIAFESITNAARHSGCSRIDVSLQLEGGRLQLAVEDDGSGLPAGEVMATGLGLRTMAYRARLLDGTFSMEVPEDGGARVRVTVPVPQGH